jgi:hypothetical protein
MQAPSQSSTAARIKTSPYKEVEKALPAATILPPASLMSYAGVR